MKIKINSTFTRTLPIIALTLGVVAVPIGRTSAQTDQDLVEVARSVIKADRQAIVVATMELTQTEAKDFWPLYNQYRSEMDKVADGMIKLVLECGALPGNSRGPRKAIAQGLYQPPAEASGQAHSVPQEVREGIARLQGVEVCPGRDPARPSGATAIGC